MSAMDNNLKKIVTFEKYLYINISVNNNENKY